MRRTGIACVSAVALLAGCWPARGQGPNRQAYNSAEATINVDTVAGLELAWSATAPETGRVSDPVVSAHGVHVYIEDLSVNSGRIHTFRLNGEQRWTAASHAADRFGSITVVDDKLAVSGFDWDVESPQTQLVDASDGHPIGSVRTGRIESARGTRAVMWVPQSLPPPYDWLLLADNINDPVAVREAGGLYTDYSSDRPSMTLGESRVYHAGRGLARSGQNTGFANAIRTFPWTGGTADCNPFDTGGLNSDYACPTWVAPLDGSSATTPVLADGEATVYAGTDAGTMYAVATENGAVQWSAPVASAVLDPPALAEGTLFVPTQSGEIVALVAATGSEQWRAATGDAIVEQPAVAGGVVFTASASGGLRAFATAGCGSPTCEPLWSADAGSPITGAPAVSSGILFVGTQDGRLLAYRPVT